MEIFMWDVIQQIKNFPIPETVHAVQGYICGVLAAHGLITDKVSFMIGSSIIAFCFVAYEGLEQLRIHDQGDSDVMVFWATAFVTGLIYFGCHKLIKKLRRI